MTGSMLGRFLRSEAAESSVVSVHPSRSVPTTPALPPALPARTARPTREPREYRFPCRLEADAFVLGVRVGAGPGWCSDPIKVVPEDGNRWLVAVLVAVPEGGAK